MLNCDRRRDALTLLEYFVRCVFRCELKACLDGSLTYFGIAEETWLINSGLSRHMYSVDVGASSLVPSMCRLVPIRSSRPRWITGRRRREEHHKSATRTRRRQTAGTGLRLGWWKSGTPSCCTTFVRQDDEQEGGRIVRQEGDRMMRQEGPGLCLVYIAHVLSLYLYFPPVSRVVWFDFLRLF